MNRRWVDQVRDYYNINAPDNNKPVFRSECPHQKSGKWCRCRNVSVDHYEKSPATYMHLNDGEKHVIVLYKEHSLWSYWYKPTVTEISPGAYSVKNISIDNIRDACPM